MRRLVGSSVIFMVVFVFATGLMAADSVVEGDKLYRQGGLENYQKAIDLYEKALAENPKNYEASWKCARTYREYGNKAKTQQVEGWKDICAKYGKAGMNMAAKAIELEPDKPEGHYYYGLSVGVYADGVSIFTALKEGLKDKTQTSFEKTYAIDKMFKEGGPMISLGRFWAVLPWPMRDRKKALQYYREYQETEYFADNMEVHVYLAELLIEMGGKENKAEAKGYLEKAVTSEDTYYSDWAKRLMDKVK